MSRQLYRVITGVFLPCVCWLSLAAAFNVDTDIPVYKIGPTGTYFGFSVAQHLRGDEPLLLVGAPRAESGQVGTSKAGAIFSCPVNTVTANSTARASLPWCSNERVEYSLETDNDDPSTQDPEDPYQKAPGDIVGVKVHSAGKNGQLLGSVISSGGRQDSGVLVCAPLLRYREAAYTDGTCYLLDNRLRNEGKVLRACNQLDKKKRHNAYGACLDGFSAVYDDRLDVLVTGAPGALTWTGGVYAESMAMKSSEKWTMSLGKRDAVEKNIEKHSYLGFSVRVGRFGFWHEEDKPLGKMTIVSGATRLDEMGAAVFLPFNPDFSMDVGIYMMLNDHFMLKGRTLASAFGYSIEVVDLNNDGFDDLLVGAPFHYELKKSKQGTKIHGGAVFVYYSRAIKQDKEHNDQVFHDPVVLLGPAASQFGLSLTKLGDINKDGYDDFAVGAPFQDSVGAVYIFHGAANKAAFEENPDPSQVIEAGSLGASPLSKGLSSFGWSLSGGIDADHNDYPDLLVGAFKSDVAVLLRSRPIISVSTAVNALAVTSIDKDEHTCSQSWAQSCFELETRVSVERRASAPDTINLSQNVFTCRLEALPFGGAGSPRVQFNDRPSKAKETAIQWACGKDADRRDQIARHKVYLPKSNRDWLNPLEFKFSVELTIKEKPGRPAEGDRLPNIDQYPVLDAQGSSAEISIPFDKKCGTDNKCESNLIVQCFLDLPQEDGIYVKEVGVDDYLNLTFKISNAGERAYDSILYIKYDSAELDRPALSGQMSGVNLGEFEEENLVTVSLGNPIPQKSDMSFTVNFVLLRGESGAIGRPLKFVASANSTSIETDPTDNECTATVRVRKEADVQLTGISVLETGDQLFYRGEVVGESAMEYEEDIGPMVVHKYTVTNKGPWGVGNVTVTIDFPYQVASPWEQGKWALYVMEKPNYIINVPGQEPKVGTCRVDQAVDRINPLGLSVNTRYAIQETTYDLLARAKRDVRPSDEPAERETIDPSRSTRELRLQKETLTIKGEEFDAVVVSCDKRTAKCFPIKCFFKNIDVDISAVITIRSRFWQSTFVEDYSDADRVLIISNGRAELDSRQGIQEDTRNNFAEAITTALPDLPTTRKTDVPIWVYIVAVVVGIFLLFLIIIICWRCGFFKRRKRTDHQPLYKAEVHTAEEWQQLN